MKINEEELKLAYTNYVIENTTDNAVLYGNFVKKIETDVEFAKQWLPSGVFKDSSEKEIDGLNPEIREEMIACKETIKIAQEEGLLAEVMYFALIDMKNNPDQSIIDALKYGINEWIK